MSDLGVVADRDALAALVQAQRYGGKVFPALNRQDFTIADRILSSSWLAEHDRAVEQRALHAAADAIQALHLGERKASVELLRGSG